MMFFFFYEKCIENSRMQDIKPILVLFMEIRIVWCIFFFSRRCWLKKKEDGTKSRLQQLQPKEMKKYAEGKLILQNSPINQ